MFNKLIFDKELIRFFETTSNNTISIIFLHGTGNLVSEEGNFIGRGEYDSVQFLPKSKYKKLLADFEKDEIGVKMNDLIHTDRPWGDGIGRTSIKIGRFIKKFIPESIRENYGIKDKDIEKYVNLYKSYFNRNPENLKIVEGKDILKWYHEENYATIDGSACGTLWGSCMRYHEKNKFMKIYTKNSNIKLLALIDDDKVLARALLWEAEDYDGNKYKVMDRIYTVYDHDVNLFIDWAKKNGYIYKAYQNAKTETLFYDTNGKMKEFYLTVKLDEKDFTKYPYLDTFKFFNLTKGILSNDPDYNYQYKLVQNDGGLFRTEDEEQVDEVYEDDNGWDNGF